MFAPGYNRRKSEAHCSTRWFGTTNNDFWHKPSLLLSIAAAIISNVFPAPTHWASNVLLPYKIWAIAFFWCGFNSISGVMPGNVKWEPSYSRGRTELNSSLYVSTIFCLRSGSRNIQSLNASFMFSCFWLAIVVSSLFSTLLSSKVS